jgi:heme/copper-type cytochrome/quinol oxidase subunit 2
MSAWKVVLPLGILMIVGTFAFEAYPKIWHVTATKDQTFVVEGEKIPIITVKAGETVHLKITAEKAQKVASDGSVHSFTIKELTNEGWNLRLKPGTTDYTLTAPSKPGEYSIQCMVPCGAGHAEQKMKLVVQP